MAFRDIRVCGLVGFLTLCCGACAPKPISQPTTSDEFIVAFTTAYERGDRETIGKLIKWDGVPSDLRAGYLDLYTTFAGKNKVTAIKIEPYDEKFIKPMEKSGQQLHFSLKPVYWFSVKTAGHAGFEGGKSTSSWEAALGYEDGKLFFCGPTMEFRRE